MDLIDTEKESLKLQEAEQVVKLKFVCDENGKEKNEHESAKILHALGKIYREKTPDRLCLIQSATLLNAAIIRSPEKQPIIEDLQELHRHVLDLVGRSSFNHNLQIITADCFKLVETMREKAKTSLQELENIPEGESKVEFIERLQSQIADDYVSTMRTISQICISVLGEVPCQFALVGVGSLARSEITPYSDFESIIVLEGNAQLIPNYESALEYFRNYSLLFQLVVIGFGETIIPCVAIPTLNNYETEGGNWFFDAITPRGVSFDGFMPHACKSPLGRLRETKNKPWTLELIQPVPMMAEFLHLDSDLKQGYHLSDILTLIRFVDGNKKVYHDFYCKVQKYVIHTDGENVEMLMRQIKEDLDTFAVFNNLPNVNVDKQINIKRVVYRTTTIFVSALGRLHGISNSSFQTLRILQRRGAITKEAQNNLMFAVSTACEVRLKVYMHKKGQNEWLSLEEKESEKDKGNEAKFIETVGLERLLKYFKVAFCLQRTIREKEKPPYRTNFLDVGLDVDVAILYYFNQYRNVVDLCSELRETYLTNHDEMSKVIACTSLIANCLYRTGEYNDALFECNKEIEYRTASKDSSQFELGNCRKAKGKCLFKLRRFKESMEEHLKEKEVLEAMSLTFADCQESIGNCLFHMDLYEGALSTFREQFETLNEVSTCETIQHAECLTNIAGCLFRLERFTGALYNYQQAMDIYCVVLNKRTKVPIADLHGKIAHCYFRLQEMHKALKSYRNELQILLEETNADENRLHDAYMNVAGCCSSCELYKDAIECYQLMMNKNFSNTNFVLVKSHIATCYMKLGDTEKALKLHQLVLDELKKAESNSKDTDAVLINSTLENVTYCLLQLGKSQEALDFYGSHVEFVDSQFDSVFNISK